MRWFLLQWQRDLRDRWRRLRDGGGALSDAVCDEDVPDSSVGELPRFEDHAGSCDRTREDRVPLKHRGGRGAWSRRERSAWHSHTQFEDGRRERSPFEWLLPGDRTYSQC